MARVTCLRPGTLLARARQAKGRAQERSEAEREAGGPPCGGGALSGPGRARLEDVEKLVSHRLVWSLRDGQERARDTRKCKRIVGDSDRMHTASRMIRNCGKALGASWSQMNSPLF